MMHEKQLPIVAGCVAMVIPQDDDDPEFKVLNWTQVKVIKKLSLEHQGFNGYFDWWEIDSALTRTFVKPPSIAFSIRETGLLRIDGDQDEMIDLEATQPLSIHL